MVVWLIFLLSFAATPYELYLSSIKVIAHIFFSKVSLFLSIVKENIRKKSLSKNNNSCKESKKYILKNK